MKFFFFAFLLVFAACGSQDEPSAEKENEQQPSDTKIELSAEGWKSLVESRVDLFGSDNFKDEGTLDEPKPGGNFMLHAYHSDGTPYLEDKRVWYFKDDEEWRFREGNDLVDYYWPYEGTLNFFAYMPYSGYTAKNHYVSYRGYTAQNENTEGYGPTFYCDLPNTNENENEEVEFIYAYAEEKNKNNGPVNLNFSHPFAIINFKLAAGSSRMTVNSLILNNIHLQGNCYLEPDLIWDPEGNVDTYTITVDKRIPNDINYNTDFAGPFVVMPQDCTRITLTMNFKRDANTDPENRSWYLTDKWEPGHVYTYKISYGDSASEIYFSVEVEEWNIEDYKNVVEVE